jgi:Zn finger protein HypA/HybF involved in hydrogenase expression
MNTKQIQDKLKALSKEEIALHKELRLAMGRQLVKCSNRDCGKRSKVSTLTYIQTHWYVAPHGCTGGDYWNPDEGQFVCPHCDYVNRLYERPDIVKLKGSFKEVINTHER